MDKAFCHCVVQHILRLTCLLAPRLSHLHFSPGAPYNNKPVISCYLHDIRSRVTILCSNELRSKSINKMHFSILFRGGKNCSVAAWGLSPQSCSNLWSELPYFSGATSKQANQSESAKTAAKACMLIQLILSIVFALYDHIHTYKTTLSKPTLFPRH